jgi:hypothetical protein
MIHLLTLSIYVPNHAEVGNVIPSFKYPFTSNNPYLISHTHTEKRGYPMIFIMFGRSIVYNLPWFIVPLKPVIIDARGFSGLRPGIQKVLEFGDSCDGRVEGPAL